MSSIVSNHIECYALHGPRLPIPYAGSERLLNMLSLDRAEKRVILPDREEI